MKASNDGDGRSERYMYSEADIAVAQKAECKAEIFAEIGKSPGSSIPGTKITIKVGDALVRDDHKSVRFILWEVGATVIYYDSLREDYGQIPSSGMRDCLFSGRVGVDREPEWTHVPHYEIWE